MPLACLCLSLGACAVNQGLKPGHESGLVSNTIGQRFRAPLAPAWIYEIDGEPVAYVVATHRLPPGEHVVRVWPYDAAPQGQVMIPDTIAIARDDIQVESVTIDVQPGYRYYVAARTNITRTTATTGGVERYEFEPNRFIVPVVVKSAAPVEPLEAVKGVSAMLLLLGIAPLLGPAIF